MATQPSPKTAEPQPIAANHTQPASTTGENADYDFVTFDSGRKHLARVVAVNGKKVTVRRFNKKSGESRIGNESRDREACIPLTAAEVEVRFPGSLAAWDKAAIPPNGSGGKVSRQLSPNSVPNTPAFQSVADFLAAYTDEKKTIDNLTDKFVDKMWEAKRAQGDLLPHFALMQSLLSKHGANHRLVIAARKQGHKIPWWTDYYESYRDKLWESLRTMERRIAKYRNDPTDREPKETERGPIRRPSKADRQRLIEASHRANELIAALEVGRDAKKEIADFKAVMDAGRLDDILQAEKHEFDFLDYPDAPVGASLVLWNNWLWGHHGSVQTRIEIAEALLRLRKNGFPYYNLTKKEKLEELRELLRHGPAPIDDSVVTQTMHALGTCWSYFPHAWEVRCNGMLTPMDVFLDDDKLLEVLEERALNGSVRSLTDSEVRKGLKSATGAQGVSGFRPTAAWAIYDLYCPDNATVYDPSAGWGGRMLGALACEKVHKYIACEPASKTFAGLKRMKADLNRLVPHRRLQVEMHRVGSEDFTPEAETVDCVVWSPPYFEGDGIVENYSDEPTQSHIRFPTREAWLEGFMGQTIRNCYAALKPGGILALNVSDELGEPVTDQAVENGLVHVETLQLRLSGMMGSTEYKNCRECQRLTGEANGTDPVVPTFGGKWKKCPKHAHKREPIFVFKRQ